MRTPTCLPKSSGCPHRRELCERPITLSCPLTLKVRGIAPRMRDVVFSPPEGVRPPAHAAPQRLLLQTSGSTRSKPMDHPLSYRHALMRAALRASRPQSAAGGWCIRWLSATNVGGRRTDCPSACCMASRKVVYQARSSECPKVSLWQCLSVLSDKK